MKLEDVLLWGGALVIIGGVAYYIYKNGLIVPAPSGGGSTSTPPTAAGLDKFGIKQFYPTIKQEWFSKWDNGKARTLRGTGNCPSPARIHDPDDSGSWLQCNPGSALGQNVRIDGKGVAEMEGKNVRYYIMDGINKWQNVEMTGYYYNVKPFSGTTNVACRLAVRTNHWNYLACPSSGIEYAYEEKINGTVQLRKELGHPWYADNVISTTIGVPTGKWVGMKIICRNTPEGWVLVEGYRDMTDGANGGDWKKVLEKLDKGDWHMAPADVTGWNGLKDGTGICKKVASPTAIIKEAADACMIRCDGQVMRFKKMSAREIAPA